MSNASRIYSGSSFTRKTLRRSRERKQWTRGQKPHLIKNGKKIHCDTANCVPFVVFGLSKSSSSSSSPTSPASSSQETVTPTEHPASARSESMSEEVRGNSSHGPAENENPNKNDDDEELQSGELQSVPSSRMDWLMKVFQNTETFPVQIMNYFQSCEQKWYRASTAFLLTSRRTEIAISAREPKLQGVLAEDVLVQSCPERGIWVI